MRKILTPGSLSGLNSVVIGLGDSSYAKYNYVGKKLFKRLKQLGAHLLLDLCLGDDQHDYGYWGAVDPFLGQLWDQLTTRFQLPRFTFAPDFVPPASFTLLPIDGPAGDEATPVPNKAETVSVVSNVRVTPDHHFQETRLIKLSAGELRHSVGDVIAIHPENGEEEVDDMLSLMGLDGSQRVRITTSSQSSGLFSHSGLSGDWELRQLIREKLDLHVVPKRSFFDLFWRFSDHEVEKEKLKEFATPEGQEELFEYCLKPKRTLIEVLRDFPHTTARIPLHHLPDLIPGIKAREFSIASSAKAVPGEIHILVVVVKFQTRLKEPRTGFCSNFLSRSRESDVIRASIRRGTFTIPPEKPLIMIGPGSGVAPFRGIIQDREVDGIKQSILFFGCRNRDADFYFEHEWKTLTEKGSLMLFTAFSRDQIQKVYVQHKMEEQKDLLFEWLDRRDAVVLIAGSSNQMPTAVREQLVLIVDHFAGDGEAFVTKLENGKRLQYECWD